MIIAHCDGEQNGPTRQRDVMRFLYISETQYVKLIAELAHNGNALSLFAMAPTNKREIRLSLAGFKRRLRTISKYSTTSSGYSDTSR